MSRLARWLQAPVDPLPLVVLRVSFGLIMLLSVLRFVARGWVREFYVLPRFHFTYYGFGWVRPLAPAAMDVLFALLALFALGIALGLCYRACAAGFFLLFSYVELLDKTYYLNHYYFVSLLSFLLIVLPLHRVCSLDAWLRPRLRVAALPAWMLAVLRLQVGLVYFFAGLAKLTPDWMLGALPLRIWLRGHTAFPLLGPLFDATWAAYLMSWGGALYDLSIPLLLCWRRTRPLAYLAVIGFHAMTGALFNIGVFPYIMVACTLVFFDGDELRRPLSRLARGAQARASASPHHRNTQHSGARALGPRWPHSLSGSTLLTLLLGCFFLLQILLPLRHLLYPGDAHWTEEGFRFSWRVMLVEKTGAARFFLRDPASGREWTVYPDEYLTYLQEKQMSFQPDMILQFAHFLAAQARVQGHGDVEVRAEVYVSLNGRPSRLLIDPRVDLAREPEGLAHRTWILDGEQPTRAGEAVRE
jgi:hypothetical protein